ncbi:MAG: hypothetical protein EBQ92_10200 [Proteobacteria bacterium]|nr:hypothetical protein [Pseudomonadota bacterium]
MRKQLCFVFIGLITTQALGELNGAEKSKWSCSGYCFLGGDTPTNPWVPVSSEGATEQDARDNIDCGPYQEVGITCEENKIKN